MTINPDGSVTRRRRRPRHSRRERIPNSASRTLEGVMTKLKTAASSTSRPTKPPAACTASASRRSTSHRVVRGRGPPRRPRVSAGVRTRRAAPATCARSARPTSTGTKTTFKPDPQIFGDTEVRLRHAARRLQELAFLNRGVEDRLQRRAHRRRRNVPLRRGLIEFVEHLNRASEPAHADVVYITAKPTASSVEVAIQYATEYTENVHSYVNNINTVDGGTHLSASARR